jgi:ATP adenylyltransferase
MDILWAPWRSTYVDKMSKKKGKCCIFCGILKENRDKKRYIFLRTAHSFAVLNIYPFNGGHALVIPKRHVATLDALKAEERVDLMEALIKVQAMIQKAFKPQAFNVGMNMGHVAGAGIPEHLHIHVVPRWSGDVNFLPALFGTKVMPISLDEVYARLLGRKKK